MSTLTKILIVLLTVSSVFLCGIIVTYVANAQDYKDKADRLSENVRKLERDYRERNDQLAEMTKQSNDLQVNLNKEIASLKVTSGELRTQLQNIQRQRDGLLQQVEDFRVTIESATQTAQLQTKLYETTQAELLGVKAELDNEKAEFDALAKELDTKLAVIATLEAEKKQLQEQLSALQIRLDQFLRDFGKEPVRPKPITIVPGEKAKPAPPVVRKTELMALITDLDIEHSFAEISIGAARGVKEGMRFFVTRPKSDGGADFICEILILDVDTEKAIGILERIQAQPKIGDNVSTSL